jgi:hypothetical protein
MNIRFLFFPLLLLFLFSFLHAQTITIIYPNGGETLTPGDMELINWTWTGTIDSVKVDYSTNNGTSWIPVEQKTLNDSTCGWNVPNNPGNTFLVKVTDASNPAVLDISDNVFTVASFVTVTSPLIGENWEVGSIDTITWDATEGIADVKLDYSTNGGTQWTTILNSTPNNGIFLWNVPNKPTTTALIRVTDTDNTSVLDMSDIFNITTSITLTSPNGGENWEVGSIQHITWTASAGITDVKIEVSTNSGGSWSTLVLSTMNTGSYGWKIPNSPYTTYRIKVSDYNNSTVSDMSNNNFTVSSDLNVIYPNGGEVFYVGEEQIISYGGSSGISEVKVEYSVNNGTSWTLINTAANDSSVIWNIPNKPSTQCLVRVTDNSVSGTTDVSNDTFEINTGLKVEEEDKQQRIPKFFSQSQNRPNPFLRETFIRYAIPYDCWVTIKVYDIRGKLVKTLVDKKEKIGYKVIRWNGTDEKQNKLSAGIYFYRINAGTYSDTKKFVLLK